MKIILPQRVKDAIALIEERGHQAYLVGGSVRDYLLEKEPKDYDLASSALPEELSEIFADYQSYSFGLKHGTLLVIFQGEPLEITTFRVEGEYSDHRRPDEVSFTDSLIDDLARRDFTFNALAYHPCEGLIDPFGGAEDLRKGIIRCVGRAEERFAEDALRIMRALRFASELDFSIEEETRSAIYQNYCWLKYISRERIAAEFNRLLCGQDATRVIAEFRELLNLPYPELESFFGQLKWPRELEILRRMPNNICFRMASLLYSLSAEERETLLGRSGLDKKQKKLIRVFLNPAEQKLSLSRAELKKFMGSFESREDFELFCDFMDRRFVFEEEKRVLLEKMRSIAAEIFANEECCRLEDLAIKGDDLLREGIPAGRNLGKLLRKLLAEVIESRLPNSRYELLRRAEILALQEKFEGQEILGVETAKEGREKK